MYNQPHGRAHRPPLTELPMYRAWIYDAGWLARPDDDDSHYCECSLIDIPSSQRKKYNEKCPMQRKKMPQDSRPITPEPTKTTVKKPAFPQNANPQTKDPNPMQNQTKDSICDPRRKKAKSPTNERTHLTNDQTKEPI
jgi:hypothetical protein